MRKVAHSSERNLLHITMREQTLDPTQSEVGRCSSGSEGLDEVLGGGWPRGHFYLLEGEPGAGKTTLALQFVGAGLHAGESVLYITLSESRKDLMVVARSHQFDLEKLEILELKPTDQELMPEGQYTVFHPAEVELSDRLQTIMSEVDKHKPDRLVIDALSEVRMLAKDPLRYRRQILALKEYLSGSKCTVLLLDDRSTRDVELELHSIVHGVVALEKVQREYGRTRRRLEVTKLRGCSFREGFHDYVIQKGGVMVFPRLVASEHRVESPKASVPCGIAELDELVGGGLDRGTSTLLMGPAGCGKTTIALRWLTTAAERGETTAAFIFEETMSTLMRRASGLGMNVQAQVSAGRMKIEQVDPAELSPGEFVEKVRNCVEDQNIRCILIDSLNGFLHSMPGERFLALHLHELLTYLKSRRADAHGAGANGNDRQQHAQPG